MGRTHYTKPRKAHLLNLMDSFYGVSYHPFICQQIKLGGGMRRVYISHTDMFVFLFKKLRVKLKESVSVFSSQWDFQLSAL